MNLQTKEKQKLTEMKNKLQHIYEYTEDTNLGFVRRALDIVSTIFVFLILRHTFSLIGCYRDTSYTENHSAARHIITFQNLLQSRPSKQS